MEKIYKFPANVVNLARKARKKPKNKTIRKRFLQQFSAAFSKIMEDLSLPNHQGECEVEVFEILTLALQLTTFRTIKEQMIVAKTIQLMMVMACDDFFQLSIQIGLAQALFNLGVIP